MSTLRYSFAVLACLCLVGCSVGSVHPWYTEKDASFEPGLVGVWRLDDATYTVTKKDDPIPSYRIVASGGDATHYEFTGHLFTLKGRQYLDILLERPANDDLYGTFVIPVHVLLWIRPNETEWEMRRVDYDWVMKYLEEKPYVVKHAQVFEDMPVLTAEPKKLQRFIKKHLQSEEAFSEWDKLTRIEVEN